MSKPAQCTSWYTHCVSKKGFKNNFPGSKTVAYPTILQYLIYSKSLHDICTNSARYPHEFTSTLLGQLLSLRCQPGMMQTDSKQSVNVYGYTAEIDSTGRQLFRG